MTYYILSDIGGTHSTFSLVEFEKGKIKEVFRHIFLTKEYQHFEEVLDLFIEMIKNYEILNFNLIIAAAGQLKDSIIKLTNSSFIINKKELLKNPMINNMELMNDFRAISYSTFDIDKNNLIELNKGESYGNKTLIVGAGTGLGVSRIENREVIDSEEGHNVFLPRGEIEKELNSFLRKKLNKEKLEYENVLSGRGLENIYSFFSNEQLNAGEISSSKDSNENSKKTFELFFKLYAKFIRELAIEHMVQKNIYIAGGVIEKNLNFSHKDFIREFTNSENHKDFLKRIPIYIIKNYDISIKGLENYIKIKDNL